jgi:hypothetical protein
MAIGLIAKASAKNANPEEQKPVLQKMIGNNQDAPPDPFSGLEGDALISSGDRLEITKQIEEIARSNRISYTAEDFIVKPARKDLSFPILVNILIIVVSAAILYGVFLLSGREVQEDSRFNNTFTTVEGNLLRQFRIDSESLISEKDQEITDIRRRLSQLEQDQNNIQNELFVRVQRQEQEYQGLMEQEIAGERQRLILAGFSDEQLERMLDAFAQERIAYYRGEMEKYQRQIGEERHIADENYQRMRDEYQENLRVLNNERQAIQEEVRVRETSYKMSKNTPVQAQVQDSKESTELISAREELAKLGEKRQNAQNRETQITNRYQRIWETFEENRYQDALDQFNALDVYLQNIAAESFYPNPGHNYTLANLLAKMAETEVLAEELAPVLPERGSQTVESGNTNTRDSRDDRIAELERQIVRLTADIKNLREELVLVNAAAVRDHDPAAAYRRLIDAYTAYTRSDAEMIDLQRFLGNEESRNSFPGFDAHVNKIVQDMVNAGHREGINSVTNILEVTLRINNTETRKRYLESIRTRYVNEKNIQAFIDILISRL